MFVFEHPVGFQIWSEHKQEPEFFRIRAGNAAEPEFRYSPTCNMI